MAKQPVVKLKKSIAEFRYRPELVHFEQLLGIAKGLTDFPHWAKRGELILLRDYERHCHVGITPGRFFYAQDSGDLEMDKKIVDLLVTSVTETLKIKEHRRFGLRRQYLVGVDMQFSELVKLCFIKLYNNDAELMKVLPKRTDDLLYRLDMSEDQVKFHVTLGVLRKAEIPRFLQVDVEEHFDPNTATQELEERNKGYPEVSLFLDIDVFSETRSGLDNGPATFVSKAREKVQGVADGIAGWVLLA